MSGEMLQTLKYAHYTDISSRFDAKLAEETLKKSLFDAGYSLKHLYYPEEKVQFNTFLRDFTTTLCAVGEKIA